MKRGLAASLFMVAVCFAFFALRQPASADEATPRFVAHEWGVWVVDAGRVAHLPALAAECPSFVIRAPRPSSGVPRIRTSPVTVEKPVLFFHTERPIDDVRVRVRFPRGEPWLVWPHARIRRRSVEWRGRITPRSGLEGLGRVIHNGQPHPWWDLLRQVGGARFHPAGESSSEDFLFYDGTMPFRSAFNFESRDGEWIPHRGGAERHVWIQDGRQVRAYDLRLGQTGSAPVTSPAASITSLLRAELLSRGLLPGEADSLLNTWRDDLQPQAQPAPQSRAIYFVDRASYDRMLPLTIRPTPDALVRVGLVIEMLR